MFMRVSVFRIWRDAVSADDGGSRWSGADGQSHFDFFRDDHVRSGIAKLWSSCYGTVTGGYDNIGERVRVYGRR